MTNVKSKYRFLLIQAFHLPKTSQYLHRSVEGPKETMLMNFENVKPRAPRVHPQHQLPVAAAA